MYYLGVDLGGTNIAVGLVNEELRIVAKDSLPTPATDPVAIVDTMAALCRRLVAQENIAFEDVAYAGIACPGIVDREGGEVIYTPNIRFDHFPLSRVLCELLPLKAVYLENDANAAALGEAKAGGARGARHSIMITLGTGVGGGIVIDGQVYMGFNCAAGELGHMVIEKDGVPCTCGRRGCFEVYSSATGLVRMTREKMEQHPESLMHELARKHGKVNGRTAFDADRAGDAAGGEVVAEYVSYLACGIVNLINIFQPEVLVIGGGVCNERENLLSRLIPQVKKSAYGEGRVPSTVIRIAELGNDAGIIGAACLGL